MEQKRTLWIVAAVGVFLLVVLGAALILYTPAARPTGTVASSRGIDNGTASNGWISLAPTSARQNQDIQNEQIEDEKPFDFNQDGTLSEKGAEFHTDEVNVYADKANVYSEKTDLSGLGNNATVVGTVSGQNQNPSQTIINNTTTIDLTEPAKPVVVQNGKTTEPIVKKSTSKVASAKENNVSKVQKSTKVAAETKSSSANVAKSFKVAKNVSKKSSKTVSSASYAKISEPEITKYWVQVTALTSRKSADEAREKLGENEITADVFTYTDNRNRLFYRVRVGPYTTKSEAEYWRNKIAKIDSFQNTSSYITSTTIAN